MSPDGTSDRSAAETDTPLRPGEAALVGLVAGAMMVGFGLLANGLLDLAIGGAMPADEPTVWSLVMWAETSVSTLVLVAGATVVLSSVAGLLSRRRDPPGVAWLVALGLLGGLGVWTFLAAGPTGAVLGVTAFATIAGVVGLVVLLRVARAARVRDLGTPMSAAPSRRPGVTRRTALLTGASLAVGAGVAGVLAAGPRFTSPRRVADPHVGPQDTNPEPLLRGAVFDVRDHGAVGDGRADDTDAILRALAAANAEHGTVYFPPGEYLYNPRTALAPATGVTLAGVPGSSTIDFTTGGPAGVVVDADDVTIDGVVLRRAADVPMVLVVAASFHGLTLSRSSIVGNMDRYPTSFGHGIKLSDSGTSGGLHILDSIVTTTTYGLFQASESVAVTTGIRVERCSFLKNRGTDLEFNSPNATTRSVEVQDCSFSDNASTEVGLGWGVGLANVQDVIVRRNRFENYPMEAVHVEDRSARVLVAANRFAACGLQLHSHVQILAGSRDVTVVANFFDAKVNTNPLYVVTAQPGGIGLAAPADIAIRNNTFECSEAMTPVYFEGTRGGAIAGNVITAPGIREPVEAFDLLDADETEIYANEVNGIPY